MILSKLLVQNVGPFSRLTQLEFEPDVTVFTGANDVGKTSILNAIQIAFGFPTTSRPLTEVDVNTDRLGQTSTPWSNDPEILCDVVLKSTSLSRSHVANVAAGYEIKFRCRLAPNCREVDPPKFRQIGTNQWSTGGSVSLTGFPEVIRLPLADSIRPVIDLEKPNLAELDFLRASFGPQFSFKTLSQLSPSRFSLAVSKAKGDANTKLRSLLPGGITLEFDFQVTGPDRKHLSVNLRSSDNAHTSISERGSGVQRTVSLMGGLMARVLEDRHFMILIDEPEASLHADAQHAVRRILESLAAKENVQVVYTTHSPAMINPLRPETLRLVKRDASREIPTSVVENRPCDQNFLSIRSSLGMSPSDSLLYAPITLIVEGPTEVIGIPLILQRLWKAGDDEFRDVGVVLPLLHVLDGCGDSFDVLCRFALSQGTKPVVFLDGDKAGSRLNQLRKHCSNVPIVCLKDRQEIEELIPRAVYFASLAEIMSQYSDLAEKELTLGNFEKWKTEQTLPKLMAFSKWVDRWVQETIDSSIEKPAVMKHAFERVDLEQIDRKPFIELLAALKEQLAQT